MNCLWKKKGKLRKMNRQILIISSSPRKGGNSDTLCEEFMKGCVEAGHDVEKINLCEHKINFCKACYACKKTGVCVQSDDMFDIAQKMMHADSIVLATPVYFYSMCGQMKTLIDWMLSYGARLAGKDFYFIATAADGKAEMERTFDGLCGFTDCLPNAKVKGLVYGAGAWQLGDIQGNPAMQEAYQMGRNIC